MIGEIDKIKTKYIYLVLLKKVINRIFLSRYSGSIAIFHCGASNQTDRTLSISIFFMNLMDASKSLCGSMKSGLSFFAVYFCY